ncbi:MAG: ABC transporter substrate-binding protein [Pseudomonadota bacterium]|jgi:NitT/TauT family transport system substrate-binding protein
MKRQSATLLVAILTAIFVLSPGPAVAGEEVSFGVLPVMQALPLFVALEYGIFAEEGIQVDLVTFRSGLEKDAAMAAGQTQGYFGDMLTSIILDANQMPVRMVATVFNTTGDQRMFAVLAAPGTGKPSLTELAGKGIAGSSNTVIEYVTAKLLEKETPGAALTMIETKNILARMPMLLQGQVAGAVLPEPLVTLVQSKGATVVADDRGLGITPTTLLFTNAYITEKPENVRAFMRAVTRASALINRDPETARPVMIKYARIPEPLQQSIAIPEFIPPEVPDRELVMDVYSWLKKKGVLKRQLTYEEMVDGDLLPVK